MTQLNISLPPSKDSPDFDGWMVQVAQYLRDYLGLYDSYATVPGSQVSFLQSGTGAVSRTVQNKERDWICVKDFGALGDNSTDDTNAIQYAIDYAELLGGGVVFFPPGIYRALGQLVVDMGGITLYGSGSSAGTTYNGTSLDLRYDAAHQIIIGNGTTVRYGISFKHMHLIQNNGSSTQYIFEGRQVRGLYFRDITFTNAYGFLKAGRSSEYCYNISMMDMEGSMATTHEHFIDCINVPGMMWLQGYGHIEGNSTPTSASCGINFGTSSVRPDGVQIGAWTIRLFDRLINLRCGCANFYVNGTILDGFGTFGIYADTDVDEINGLSIQSCHLAPITSALSIDSSGILISRSSSPSKSVQLIGNKLTGSGGYGYWVSGDMDVVIIGNVATSCGQETNDTYSSFRIGTGIKGTMVGNVSNSISANKVKYGYKIETAEIAPAWDKGHNVSIGHVTSAEG
jgi:hypothetical protein